MTFVTKFDPPVSGTKDGVTLVMSGKQAVGSWSSSGPIYLVIVKAGPAGANVYTYPGGSLGDTLLVPPVNKHGTVPDISHVEFCTDPVAVETLDDETQEEAAVEDEIVEETIDVSVEEETAEQETVVEDTTGDPVVEETVDGETQEEAAVEDEIVEETIDVSVEEETAEQETVVEDTVEDHVVEDEIAEGTVEDTLDGGLEVDLVEDTIEEIVDDTVEETVQAPVGDPADDKVDEIDEGTDGLTDDVDEEVSEGTQVFDGVLDDTRVLSRTYLAATGMGFTRPIAGIGALLVLVGASLRLGEKKRLNR